MNTAYSLLQLHLSQAESALQRAKNNCYSDKRKQDYQNNLIKLFEAIYEESKDAYSIADNIIYNSYKLHLWFIFKSLEFLDSSTLNQIPYEIVECLDYAMNDWVDVSKDKYIIVTSLINDVEAFSFDPSLAFNDQLFDEINTKYKINFEYRLVQINVPKTLSRDYLAAVVLYHELGHFIDNKYFFTESLSRDFLNKIVINGKFSNEEIDSIVKYFPFLKSSIGNGLISTQSNIYYLTRSHFAEYFCDLFASQYIGESSNHYLTYLTSNNGNFSYSHPSTVNRVNVVSDFLSNNKDNIIVKLISDAVEKISKKKLENRYDNVEVNDLLDLLPLTINSTRELHGVYDAAWKVWLNDKDKIAQTINNNHTPLKIYRVINNLIEKSIGNFITINKWKQAQSKQVMP